VADTFADNPASLCSLKIDKKISPKMGKILSGVVVGLPHVFAEGVIACQRKTLASPTRC